MARCKFCMDYEKFKDAAKEHRKKEGIYTTFKFGLRARRTLNGELIGTPTYGFYPLTFCPQCGTKLIKARRQKKQL